MKSPDKVTSSILQAGSLALICLVRWVVVMVGGGGGFGVGEEGNKMSILEAEPPAMQA